MKLTPLARRIDSSAGVMPWSTLGVLAISSFVKNHWFCRATVGLRGTDGAGEGAAFLETGRTGDLRDECVGGEGTAGGTSRRRVGDTEGRFCAELGFGGSTGGW